MPAEINPEVDLSTVEILIVLEGEGLAALVAWPNPDGKGPQEKELIKIYSRLFMFLYPLIKKWKLLHDCPVSPQAQIFYHQFSVALLVLLRKEGSFQSWYKSVGIFPWDKRWRNRILREISCSRATADDIFNVILENLKDGFPPDVEDSIARALQKLDPDNSNSGALRAISELLYPRFADIARRKLDEGQAHAR